MVVFTVIDIYFVFKPMRVIPRRCASGSVKETAVGIAGAVYQPPQFVYTIF